MARLLYIHRGNVPPPLCDNHDRFHFLSQICSGDVLLPVWWRTAEEAFEKGGAYPEFARGRFTYHFFLDTRQDVRGSVARAVFYVQQALHLHKTKGAYDAVMTYGTNSTGLAALLISRVLRTPLIVEIPGVPEDAFLFEAAHRRWSDRLKHAIADVTLKLVVRGADHVKLLYPTQLAGYPSLKRVPSSTFHDFVPVAGIDGSASDAGHVLFLGHPWYLKGVDVLIQAFRAIADQVPQYRLCVVGHFPDRTRLDELAQGCPQIEIRAAMMQPLALKAISSCSVFVLPSRSEAMGRVLIEAMAAGKPIVASRVGGVPHYVRDGENGLLTTPGAITDLSSSLLAMLKNPALARRLGDRGRQLARSEYDETAYVRHFAEMLSRIGLDCSAATEQRVSEGLQVAGTTPP